MVYGRLTRVEFDTAEHRNDSLTLMSGLVEAREQGFEAAYYVDVDELHIVSFLIFDSQEGLDAIGSEYQALQARAQEMGATFTSTDDRRLVAFATSNS